MIFHKTTAYYVLFQDSVNLVSANREDTGKRRIIAHNYYMTVMYELIYVLNITPVFQSDDNSAMQSILVYIDVSLCTSGNAISCLIGK